MRAPSPAERLCRRLGVEQDVDEDVDPDVDPATDLDVDPATEPDAERRRGPSTGPGRLAVSGKQADRDDLNHYADDTDTALPDWLPTNSRTPGLWSRVRADPGRAGTVGLAVIAALAVLVTVATMITDRPAPVTSAKLPAVHAVAASSAHDDPDHRDGPAVAGPVVVSVVGLVHAPGLVTLPAGSRVADALTAAGGAVAGADTTGLNVAQVLADGEQIVVGLAAQPGASGSSASSVAGEGPVRSTGPTRASGSGSTPGMGSPPGARTPPGSGHARARGSVDLNSATVEQLDALPGVGPVMAAAIVAWRQRHGRFRNVDQLGEVTGIGPSRLAKLRALVRI